MAIVLQESLRGLFYAPYYAALALGAYEQEGVAVRFVAASDFGAAPDGLFAGTVDVAWGGPMRVNQFYGQRADCDLVCFGEAVTRDPFLLVGRAPHPNFAITDLAAARIATVSEVPTPWLCLEGDLRDAGIDPARLDRLIGRSMPENVAGLTSGEIDVAQLFEPFVELAVRGGAHVWLPASERGRTSYTVFATTRERLAADPEPFRRMTRAIYRTQQWVAAQSPHKLADTIAEYFPTLDRAVLTGSLTRYKAQGVWGTDPILPEEGFDRLRRALLANGFLARTVPFGDCVNNRLAEEAASI